MIYIIPRAHGLQLMQTAKYKEIEPTANTKIAVAMALLLANALACVLYFSNN